MYTVFVFQQLGRVGSGQYFGFDSIRCGTTPSGLGELRATTDLTVKDRHDDEDADHERIDDELALEVGAVNSTTERVLDRHVIEIL